MKNGKIPEKTQNSCFLPTFTLQKPLTKNQKSRKIPRKMTSRVHLCWLHNLNSSEGRRFQNSQKSSNFVCSKTQKIEVSPSKNVHVSESLHFYVCIISIYSQNDIC